MGARTDPSTGPVTAALPRIVGASRVPPRRRSSAARPATALVSPCIKPTRSARSSPTALAVIVPGTSPGKLPKRVIAPLPSRVRRARVSSSVARPSASRNWVGRSSRHCWRGKASASESRAIRCLIESPCHVPAVASCSPLSCPSPVNASESARPRSCTATARPRSVALPSESAVNASVSPLAPSESAVTSAPSTPTRH